MVSRQGKKMAIRMTLTSSSSSSSSPCTISASFLPKPSSLPYIQFQFYSPKKKSQSLKVHAKLGGGEEEIQKPGKKKFITKEQEPQQYWQTAGEREGENPMMTPLPYIIIFGMSTPFIILAIGFFNGWIKVPIR